jgi:hypothetical protein
VGLGESKGQLKRARKREDGSASRRKAGRKDKSIRKSSPTTKRVYHKYQGSFLAARARMGHCMHGHKGCSAVLRPVVQAFIHKGIRSW